MPLYDYQCTECNHIFEAFHKIADSGPSNCPECNGTNVRKAISAIRGSVELTGQELNNFIKQDAARITREASKDESTMANLVGEDKFQSNVETYDKVKKGF